VNLINHGVVSYDALIQVLPAYLVGKWSHILLSKAKPRVCVRARNGKGNLRSRETTELNEYCLVYRRL